MKKAIISLLLISMLTISFPTQAFAVQKAAASTVETTAYANIDWWKDINDEILLDYIIKAIQCNQDLKLANLKVGESTELKNLKRANEMPIIGTGVVPALYKLPTQTSSDGFISVPLYASYEADLFGKNRDKTKSMDKSIEIAQQNERAANISVTSAVGTTYYNIVKLDKIIEIQQQIINDRQQIYALMKLSNEEGLISTADTVSANKAFIKANSDLIEQKKAREQLLNTLCVLIGESPENSANLRRIAFDDAKINKQIPDYINSEIIEQRPDYIAAEKSIEKSGLDVRAAKKEFLPSFNILGLISFNSSNYLSKMNWTNSLAVLGAGALLPLFTGGSRIANLKLNKNKYEQAIENYKKVNLTAIQEVNDSLCTLKLDEEKYLKTLESYQAEKEDFSYTNMKFNEGLISRLDLLQKRETLLSTEKLLTSDQTNRFINQIGLYKAVAGAKIQ